MCFSGAWIVQLIVWLIILCGIVAILQIVIPFILSKLQPSPAIAEVVNLVVRILWIIFWVVVCIFLVYFVYDMISCLWGSGLSLRPLR